MAVALARKMKGKKLKDWCMIANCEQSRNSNLSAWPQSEMSIFKQAMMRRCEWTERDYSRKLPSTIRPLSIQAQNVAREARHQVKFERIMEIFQSETLRIEH